MRTIRFYKNRDDEEPVETETTDKVGYQLHLLCVNTGLDMGWVEYALDDKDYRYHTGAG